MSGLNSIMETSLSGLYAAQAGMATTGHNIANANTEGFNRQRVDLSARQAVYLSYGAIGRGVDIDGVSRVQDEFILANLRSQTAQLESYRAIDSTLYEVEAILGSLDNDHLGNALSNFFNSWNALAQPPINTTLKQDVVSTATSLVQDFHSLNNSLDDLEDNIELNIQLEISNLNILLEGVAGTNEQILSAEANGTTANDLRDQQDLLISQISEIAEVTIYEREDGTKDVILAGRTMVARDSFTIFESEYVETSSGYEMSIVTQGHHQSVQLSTGKLEGLMESRDTHVADVRDRLDALAKNLIDQVNELHTQGRTGISSGVAFFSGDSMHTIEVNPALEANPDMVATGTTAAEGDNAIAMAISELADVGGAGDMSVGDEYRAMLTVVASKRSNYEFMLDNQQNVVATLEAKRASVSGVSLDEEGANMIKYQNSYNAAARVISVVQDMFETLLSMT